MWDGRPAGRWAEMSADKSMLSSRCKDVFFSIPDAAAALDYCTGTVHGSYHKVIHLYFYRPFPASTTWKPRLIDLQVRTLSKCSCTGLHHTTMQTLIPLSAALRCCLQPVTAHPQSHKSPPRPSSDPSSSSPRTRRGERGLMPRVSGACYDGSTPWRRSDASQTPRNTV